MATESMKQNDNWSIEPSLSCWYWGQGEDEKCR